MADAEGHQAGALTVGFFISMLVAMFCYVGIGRLKCPGSSDAERAESAAVLAAVAEEERSLYAHIIQMLEGTATQCRETRLKKVNKFLFAPDRAQGPGAELDAESQEMKEERNEECAICLATYTTGEELGTLACSHTFHYACVGKWLSAHAQCPICRQDLTYSPATSSLWFRMMMMHQAHSQLQSERYPPATLAVTSEQLDRELALATLASQYMQEGDNEQPPFH
ncbi:unnamed protein product [Chrysoparadoxa australica]